MAEVPTTGRHLQSTVDKYRSIRVGRHLAPAQIPPQIDPCEISTPRLLSFPCRSLLGRVTRHAALAVR
jgi:hypothetical protein